VLSGLGFLHSSGFCSFSLDGSKYQLLLTAGPLCFIFARL
jgi:hypothetical protein